MFETADPKQPFLVINQIELYPKDEEILIKLYQPLVGATALSLYHTLMQDYDPYSILSDAEGIYVLQEQLDCSLKELFSSLHKLEAVGLIQTFLVDNVVNQVLAFKILKVPSAQEYFATPLLASLLKEKVGQTTFQKQSHYFAKKNKQRQKTIKNAKNISATFLEVFRLPGDEAINPSDDVVKAAEENSTTEVKTAKINNNDHVDWAFMKDQFARYQIPASEVEQNQAKILGIMQTYGLTEQEFVDESLPSLHGKNTLDLFAIERLLADNYKSASTRKQVNQTIRRERKVVMPTNISSDKQKLLKDANSMSPAEFLYQMKSEKGGFASPGEKRVLNVLRTQYGLPSDLINVLVYACLTYDSMVSTNLAYRIANDWLQHGIASSVQALQYLEKRKEGRTQKQRRYYQNNKRIEKGTDWSKKKAKTDTNVNSQDLKNFFKSLEDKNEKK